MNEIAAQFKNFRIARQQQNARQRTKIMRPHLSSAGTERAADIFLYFFFIFLVFARVLFNFSFYCILPGFGLAHSRFILVFKASYFSQHLYSAGDLSKIQFSNIVYP